MKKEKLTTAAAAAAGMLVLILDGKTALSGAAEGIDLCLRTLIPSLFPFFVFSNLLTGNLMGQPLRLLRPLGKLCHIPEGYESLLAIGMLGGYPVGAQNIASAWKAGQTSREDAQRMIVFCNNAGPAFLFGIISPMFSDPWYGWKLWLIHMASALIVGTILPAQPSHAQQKVSSAKVTLSQALERSVKVMGLVCGWVILMRMVLTFLERWLFWAFPVLVQVLLTGILELTNGCIRLAQIENEGLRFLFASAFLSLGGLCVMLQTRSVTAGLDLPGYFPGKLLQASLSLLLAAFLQDELSVSPLFKLSLLILSIILAAFLQHPKKAVAFRGK